MERLDECRQLYFELMMMELENKLNYDTKRQSRHWISLKKKLRNVLSTLQLKEKFRHSIFDSILNEKCIDRPNWNYELVSRAFGHLETYCRLLRSYPWKTEYHTLKTYGGFFRTYIHSVLPSSMMILRIMGYSPIGDHSECANGGIPNILELDSLPNIALLGTLGFDCFAASVECEIRLEAANSISNKITNLKLDEIIVKTHAVADHITKNHLFHNRPRLSDYLTEKKRILSLPKELEPYPRANTPLNNKLIRSMDKSRTYHFDKLNMHLRRRDMFRDYFGNHPHGDGVSHNTYRDINLEKMKFDYNTSAHPPLLLLPDPENSTE